MIKPTIVLCNEPFVVVHENILTESECHQLIDLAQNHLQPATVVSPSEGLQITDFRISDHAWFPHHSHEVVHQVSERVASTVGQPLQYAEQLQIVRYKIGGKFDAHFDCHDPSSELGKLYFNQYGQRLYTAILYLNHVEEGGETIFPELGFQISPYMGAMLFFENCKKGTNESNPLSMHGSLPVKKGEKWIATLWFCEKPQY